MSDPFRDIEEKERTEPTDEAKYWAKELDLARKRQTGYRKDAEEVVKIYEGESTRENSFNILYSNTETLLPAIYNQLPRPDVGLTFPDDPDDVAKAGAEVLERMLKNITAAQTAEYDQTHRLFQQAVLGGLVPGQGITRWFYDAEIKTKTPPVGDPNHKGADDAAQNPDATVFVPDTEKGRANPPASGGGQGGAGGEGGTKSRVHYEFICGKDLDYDQVLYGYARRWVDVPWVGFEHFMHLDDLRANFGQEIADSIDLQAYSKRGHEGWKDKTTVEEGAENHGSQPGAYVVEIWNRAKREVVFYCESAKMKLLGEPREDPYELSGFYPICEPLKFQKRTSGIVPKPVYKLYEQQAKELNRVSIRINRILNALKVRGFYDGSLGSLKDLLRQDDNTLLPATNASAFYEGKTLDNAIWLMPLDKLITVLQQLWQGREQIKNTIYEITGISDIMRGDTQASETFGAQNLKSKWGTQRLQGFQGEVQRYCRDCFRIIAEMAAKNFGQPTMAKITGLDYATDEEVKQAQKMIQMGQMMMLRMQQAAPPAMPEASGPGAPSPGAAAAPPGQSAGIPSPAGAPPPPSPPQPPALPPQLQQAMQQAQAVLQKLKWSDIIEVIAEDVSREYRIDIETNSTIDPTRQEDKQDITEVMTALANTVESFGPLVEQGVIPMPVFKGMLKTIVSRFTFGKRVEQAIDAMPDQVPPTVNNTPPPPGGAAGKPPPSPEEVQADQMEQQNRIQLAQAQSGLIGGKMQLESLKLKNDLARESREGERAQLEHELEMATIRAKIQATSIGLDQKRQGAAVDLHAKMTGAAIDTHARATGAAIQTGAAREGAMIKNQAAREGAEISTQAARDGAMIAKQRGQDANKLAKAKGNGQQKR